MVIARLAIRALGGVLVALSLAMGGAALAQPILPEVPPDDPPDVPPADRPDAQPQTAPRPNWALHLGPGVVWTPKFDGARERSFVPIPVIDLRYKQDLFFVSVREGVGSTLLNFQGFRAGPILRLNGGRGEGASDHLRGLGGVPLTIEGGAFAKYDFGRYGGARIELRRGLGGHNGWLLDIGADAHARLGAVGFSVGPRMSIADGGYNRAFYGVDQEQSARSGYARYEPGFRRAQRGRQRQRPVARHRQRQRGRDPQLWATGGAGGRIADRQRSGRAPRSGHDRLGRHLPLRLVGGAPFGAAVSLSLTRTETAR